MSRARPAAANSSARPAWRGWTGVIVAASVVALCAPFLSHGPLWIGSDVYATVHYLQGFAKAFSEGDLLPRWTDRTNQDLGAPSFVIFPPLFFYGAGAAWWLTGSLIGGIKLWLFVVTALTAVAFYSLARDWVGPGIASAAGTALYLLLPYHVLDMYQRFAMSETTSFIFFPLILLFARRILRGGTRLAFLGLVLSYAGLICTHLVSAFLFSLVLGLWLLWEARAGWRSLLKVAAALVCGIGLAAPILLPAAVEKAYVNINWVREAPNGDFRINFIFKDEILPGLGFKDPVKPPVLKSAHSMLALACLAAWLALSLISKEDRRRRSLVVALLAGCVLAYIMEVEVSTPIWLIVPELATVQFPWRFQTIMVLGSALLTAFAIDSARGGPSARRSPSAARAALLSALGVAAVVNLALGAQNAYLKPFTFDEDDAASPGVVGWTDPSLTPVQFEAYRTFRQRRLEVRQAAFAEGTGEARVATWESSRRVLEIRSEAGGRVEVGSFWFPGWTGRLDGAPLDLRPSSPYATVTFSVPPGRHVAELRFEATPIRRAAGWIGLASVMVSAAIAWWLGANARTPSVSAARPAPARRPDRA